jgi:squalene-hopene/tetraprenyl-beta-curcumene cyclase
MTAMIDFHQLLAAYQTARHDLLAEREASGHWVGRLSSSALSTATAASALAVVAGNAQEESRRQAYRELAARAVGWLAGCQNADGGWGDTDKSFSNIATTMLVEAAFHLAGTAGEHAGPLGRARAYIDAQGGIAGLRRRYGPDRTFAVPILANCALASRVSWREVPPLPFELACLPHAMFRFLRLPVVSYAIPALVAVGQARYFHRWPRNPLVWLVRRLAVRRSLRTLASMQPPSGGFLEAVPLTSFVVMSLASTGRAEHAVTRRSVGFLLDTVRADGSWPIDTNLAVWNTTLAVGALAAASGDVGALGCLEWLLDARHRRVHPFTHAAPGGWGWNDAAGAVPDTDDTSGALLALRILLNSGGQQHRGRIEEAALAGVDWLLAVQNADGGWPTFCRGWGKLPFDRSGTDLTAHAVRALHAWQHWFPNRDIDRAIRDGLDYLAGQQRTDGSWCPLWFANQHHSEGENPIYGTARVLLAYRDLGLIESEPAQRGLRWLAGHADAGGGWGGPFLPSPIGRGTHDHASHGTRPGGEGPPLLIPNPLPQTPGRSPGALISNSHSGICNLQSPIPASSSIEETGLAIEALLADPANPSLRPVLEGAIQWLLEAVAVGRHRQPAPIGLYFAKLGYYEQAYPLVFAVGALGHALRQYTPSAAGDH